MTTLHDSLFLVLKPTKFGRPDENGIRPVTDFRVEKIRRGKPYTDPGEIITRLNITIDSSVFEAVIPVIDVEIGEHDVTVNARAEVSMPEPDQTEEERLDAARDAESSVV